MMLAPDIMPGKLDEFIRPVESIMRCEDFKSNFARKLSNRYISRAPMSAKDTALKLPKSDTDLLQNIACLLGLVAVHSLSTPRASVEVEPKAPERIECTQLSKSVCEQHGEAVKPPDKTNGSDMRSTEVCALNMEVETLRWQLTQTENNRQMHIALLKQVVSFLSRVKEHIECQKPEQVPQKESMSRRLTPRSFNAADLPRSRSVVHVNKNFEFSLSPTKKFTAKKISKSISNVNGFRESNGVWSPSKLFSTPEEESTQKISEEMSRLITLANTVLSTKIPDLACTYNDTAENVSISEMIDNQNQKNYSISSLNLTDEDITNSFILNTICDGADTFNGLTNDFIEAKNGTIHDFILSPSPLPSSGLENDFAEVKIIEKENSVKTVDASTKTQRFVEKRNEYNHAGSFIEDESGFSSMSSFQEIGIPIISIIPPSPCKEVSYMDDITDILEDTKWKSDPVDLDKQSVKVFWV